MQIEELFESYLRGKMSESDIVLFEKLLDENPEYQSQLDAFRKSKFQPKTEPDSNLSTKAKSIKNWIISISISLVIVVAGYFLFSILSMSPGQKLYNKYYETYPNEVSSVSLDGNASGLKTQAFQAYDNGDFQKAAKLFEQVKTQADSDIVLLYLGICQLELDRPEKAIPVLSQIPANSRTASKEVASWYEALGYFKLNMLEEGKKSLQIPAAKANPYQAQAKAILESLK